MAVKTNQNLAEPFLFLTKRILNITDTKALYFVSKISELNLIESMLQQKSQEQEHPPTAAQAPPANLDGLFGASDVDTPARDVAGDKGGGKRKPAKGGNYLDEVLFKMGDEEAQAHKEDKSQIQATGGGGGDSFLADMMNNKPTPTARTKVKTPKAFTPKQLPAQSRAQPARHRASSATGAKTVKAAKTVKQLSI